MLASVLRAQHPIFNYDTSGQRYHNPFPQNGGFPGQPHYPTGPLTNSSQLQPHGGHVGGGRISGQTYPPYPTTHSPPTFGPLPKPNVGPNINPNIPNAPQPPQSGGSLAKQAPFPPLIPEPPPGSLVAYISTGGIVGYMLFTPGAGGTTAIRYHIIGSPRSESFRWMIYSQPTLPQSFTCPSTVIGTMESDLTPSLGRLNLGRDIVLSSNLDLVGEKSIMGKSLVLEGVTFGTRICATLLPATRKTFAEAKFHEPISGIVRILQTSARTGIIAEYLMYSNGERKDSIHHFAFIQGTAVDATPDARYKHEKERCKNLIGVFVFDSKATNAKAKRITVSTEMPTIKGRSYQTIQPLISFESMPVVFMALFEENDPQKIIACVALNVIEPKKASAKFQNDDIQGSMQFVQETPYDPTHVTADISLKQAAYSYGIDVLPTIKRRTVETKKCPNARETIYNPYNKDPEEVPVQGTGSSDQYAVGDLSGKYGALENVREERFKTVDVNLPLFGYFSVIGRAVIVYTPDGPPIGCANINLLDVNLTTSYATFDVPYQGQFIFRQRSEKCYDDVYIYIEISKPEKQESEKSFNHPWHVHANHVDAGVEHLSSTECIAAGGHLNTFNVSTECIYQRDCTTFTSLRCEDGDETGKLGAIDIPVYKLLPGGEPDVGKYYFIDNNVANCGPSTIIGRSIVIHEKDFGAARVTCANILEFKPKP